MIFLCIFKFVLVGFLKLFRLIIEKRKLLKRLCYDKIFKLKKGMKEVVIKGVSKSFVWVLGVCMWDKDLDDSSSDEEFFL